MQTAYQAPISLGVLASALFSRGQRHRGPFLPAGFQLTSSQSAQLAPLPPVPWAHPSAPWALSLYCEWAGAVGMKAAEALGPGWVVERVKGGSHPSLAGAYSGSKGSGGH